MAKSAKREEKSHEAHGYYYVTKHGEWEFRLNISLHREAV